mmetsp:Transcript_6888/g.17619  ORF Transcript_6888/g.17619 Transcript_6888/m.17619 type:complete len:185 (+) Transcript_6888:107-661(+)|eukprot:CAMPEP_0202038650 /NCGR_PEP_ID=MMETSP0962-20130828/11321_1 /ASSEMBLY_ACC=CAM_ASM_000488 /TAXON_ID=4773 /ORGANISM="Schizochytrium aggregatum, Strain ATCC28209" /LENGTH=184 /DNA_ID=CAMNT_0048602823 /DNA_START=95 /DNA_END=649 /DNA_ORIENTATION=+
MAVIEEVPEERQAELRQRKPAAEAADKPKAAEPAAGEEIDLSDGKRELLKRIVKEGSGEVCGQNKAVTVHYTGRFASGKVFDSSVKRGRPFYFNIGRGNVVKGWEVGVASMKVGEKAILTCKPSYAYGSNGVGSVIPPNATLEFEIELLDFESKSNWNWVVFPLGWLFMALFAWLFVRNGAVDA